jgi:hypothetical protein
MGGRYAVTVMPMASRIDAPSPCGIDHSNAAHCSFAHDPLLADGSRGVLCAQQNCFAEVALRGFEDSTLRRPFIMGRAADCDWCFLEGGATKRTVQGRLVAITAVSRLPSANTVD